MPRHLHVGVRQRANAVAIDNLYNKPNHPPTHTHTTTTTQKKPAGLYFLLWSAMATLEFL